MRPETDTNGTNPRDWDNDRVAEVALLNSDKLLFPCTWLRHSQQFHCTNDLEIT